jgi:hypothetical protein
MKILYWRHADALNLKAFCAHSYHCHIKSQWSVICSIISTCALRYFYFILPGQSTFNTGVRENGWKIGVSNTDENSEVRFYKLILNFCSPPLEIKAPQTSGRQYFSSPSNRNISRNSDSFTPLISPKFLFTEGFI